MSQPDETEGISRRRVLQAAASIVPLHVGSRVAAALERLGTAGRTQQQGDDLLALGAREAVAHIVCWIPALRAARIDPAIAMRA